MNIIYKQDNGILAIITHINKTRTTIEDVAKIVVPKGKPYKIVDKDYFPTDRTYRNSWTIEDDLLTDGIGGV